MPEDFFVNPIECMGCGAPPTEAPDLMQFTKSDEGYWHCRFVRQPENHAEEDQACRGVWASCCGAAAYRGKDKRIIERIAILNANKGQFRESLGTDNAFAATNNEPFEGRRPILSIPNPGLFERLFRRFK